MQEAPIGEGLLLVAHPPERLHNNMVLLSKLWNRMRSSYVAKERAACIDVGAPFPVNLVGFEEPNAGKDVLFAVVAKSAPPARPHVESERINHLARLKVVTPERYPLTRCARGSWSGH